jgi:DNA-binding NarL/FixJ family response regulator
LSSTTASTCSKRPLSSSASPWTYFVRGFLAVLQNDPAAARPALQRGVTAAMAAGQLDALSQSLAMASIATDMAGDRASSGRLLDAARVVADGLEDLGTTLMMHQARALNGILDGDLDAVGSAASEGGEADPPAAAASDHGGAGVLRQRETDVARLVAEGLSNKEIGARLFISERTVESHVRNIMNKLGFNTRAQIAGWIEPRIPDLPVDDARRDGGEVSRRAAEQVPAAVCALQIAMSLVLPGDTDGAVQLDHLARGLGQCL